MPLQRISSQEAMGRLRNEGRRVVWPDHREPEKRLDGLVTVSSRASFEIDVDDKIFTMGSCFARNIERRLGEIGFTTPMFDAALETELAKLGHIPGFLNKYNTSTMRTELEWALGLPKPAEDLILLPLEDGTVHDMFSTPDRRNPHDMHQARASRALITERAGQIAQCRVIIMTLGMAEVWCDTKSGLRINLPPPTSALQAEPDRFVLDVLSYQDVLDDMEAIHAALSEGGHPDFKMLVTVSPIPLNMTFRAQDVIAANTYSKAVQRAALEAFVLAHDNVDYFPSFEPVTLSDRRIAYEIDNRHVQTQVVSRIVDRFMNLYAPKATFEATSKDLKRTSVQDTPFDLAVTASMHLDKKMFVDAADFFAMLFAHDLTQDHTLKEKEVNVDVLRIRYAFCLSKIGDAAGADRELSTVVASPDLEPHRLLRCADIYVALNEDAKALAVLATAETRGVDPAEITGRRARISA